MSDLKGLTITCASRHRPTVILLRGKPGPEAPAVKLNTEGVRLAEFLDTELPAITLQALAARLAEITGGVTDVALRDLARELAAVLRGVEWVEGWCPSCGANRKSRAHGAGCKLRSARRKAEVVAGND